jgi:type II secretory pathway pseudopilin PulG
MSAVVNRVVKSALRRRIKGRRIRNTIIAGYTVIEVIMAMSVLAIGATGIIAMQKATLVGNVNARDLAVANGIAATWMERLRQDSLQWVVNANDGTNTIAGTTWLNVVGQDFPAVVGDEGKWILPMVSGGMQPQFDVTGNDTTVAGEVGFCTHIRLTQLLDKTIRADVRVFWLRWHGAGHSADNGTIGGVPLCTDDDAYVLAVGAEQNRYHFIYVTSGIIPNQI